LRFADYARNLALHSLHFRMFEYVDEALAGEAD
jgi:hypothetical protein